MSIDLEKRERKISNMWNILTLEEFVVLLITPAFPFTNFAVE